MANMKELLPKGEYKIKTVGPNREWEYNGNKNITDSVQLEGHEQYWIDLNRAADKPAPAVGDTIKGHVEQDEQGKFPPKFKKEYGGGGGNWGGGGGKGASAGAIWSSAVETAATIVAAYAEISGKKPKSMTEFLGQIEKIAPKVNAMVDKLKDANKPAETTTDTAASESGESAAPAAAPAAPKADIVEDISDEELGDW